MDIHYDYDRFGCRHTLVSLHRVTLFFTVFSFSSIPLPVPFFLLSFSPRFSFLRSRPLRCCMYMYMCVFFFLLFWRVSEALASWLKSNSQGRVAQLSEWRDQRCTALTAVCATRFFNARALFPEMLVKVDWGRFPVRSASSSVGSAFASGSGLVSRRRRRISRAPVNVN